MIMKRVPRAGLKVLAGRSLETLLLNNSTATLNIRQQLLRSVWSFQVSKFCLHFLV